MAKFYTELMVSERLTDGRKTYYRNDECEGRMVRISRQEWDRRYDSADGLQSLCTRSSKTHRRTYRTAIYEHAAK